MRPESRTGGYTDGRQRSREAPLPFSPSGSPYSINLPFVVAVSPPRRHRSSTGLSVKPKSTLAAWRCTSSKS